MSKDATNTEVKVKKSKSPKGKNYSKGHSCMLCEAKRTIRGKLCIRCRKEVVDAANEAM